MYEGNVDAETGGLLALFAGAYLVFMVVVYLIYSFCIGKVLEKAGKPLWAGFVPIYNVMLLLEIVGRPTWWIILFLIPFVNLIVMVIVCVDIAKSFGKDVVYGVLLALVGLIMWPVLAFSDATYTGPSVTTG